MKIKAIVSAFIAVLAMTALAQTAPDWENPAVLGINKLPYHATLQLPSKWKECKEIVSLDGQWLFHWSRKPEERPVNFYREDYDVSGWGTSYRDPKNNASTQMLGITHGSVFIM